MLAFDLIQRVSKSLQEVVIGSQDSTFQIELDRRLGLADCSQLTLIIGILQFSGRGFDSVLHNLERLAVAVDDGVVRSLNPNFSSALRDAFVFAGIVLAFVQIGPELSIFRAGNFGGRQKQAVMFSADFVQCVPECFQEVFVGMDDCAIHLKLDNSL